MRRPWHVTRLRLPSVGLALLWLAAMALPPVSTAAAAELSSELKSVPHKIVYETWRENNWELFVAAADGSQAVNLTKTPPANELYPRVSPDG